eukprot:m.288240 g.288240  ORF g.288240 m.288240 type:complete len:58 (-) comp200008_c0_seq1:57-230(-)
MRVCVFFLIGFTNKHTKNRANISSKNCKHPEHTHQKKKEMAKSTQKLKPNQTKVKIG